MTVYHGSDMPIEKIDFDRCRYRKDFGRGFYVTALKEQAETMAARVAKWNRTTPAVTEFHFNEFVLTDNDLKILRFSDYTNEWLDFVTLNRGNETQEQVHDYDIVEGPVANDRISTQIDDYINGAISREQFLSDLIYSPSHQICFCTVQSLQALELSKGKIDSQIFHTDDNVLQALMLDFGLPEIEAIDKYYTSRTYTQFADETTELYKKQWQEIYKMLKQELGSQ